MFIQRKSKHQGFQASTYWNKSTIFLVFFHQCLSQLNEMPVLKTSSKCLQMTSKRWKFVDCNKMSVCFDGLVHQKLQNPPFVGCIVSSACPSLKIDVNVYLSFGNCLTLIQCWSYPKIIRIHNCSRPEKQLELWSLGSNFGQGNISVLYFVDSISESFPCLAVW